jgi:hypothetical protein
VCVTHTKVCVTELLPPIIEAKWVYKHFIKHADSLYKTRNCSRDSGDPSHAGGMANKATILLQIPEFQELSHLAKFVHYEFNHATAGTIQRQFSFKYWHFKIMLAVQQIIVEYIKYQLMKKPDPIFGTLTPTIPLQPLIKWAFDYTFWGGSIILVMVEYATNWVKAAIIPSRK